MKKRGILNWVDAVNSVLSLHYVSILFPVIFPYLEKRKKKFIQIQFLFLFFDFARKYTGRILRKIRENNLGIRNPLVTICFY